HPAPPPVPVRCASSRHRRASARRQRGSITARNERGADRARSRALHTARRQRGSITARNERAVGSPRQRGACEALSWCAGADRARSRAIQHSEATAREHRSEERTRSAELSSGSNTTLRPFGVGRHGQLACFVLILPAARQWSPCAPFA